MGGFQLVHTSLQTRDCTGRPFLGFLGFGLFGKITRVLGRVFGLLLVREKELICEKAYIFISHFKAYDCYTSKCYFFFIFDRKWDLSPHGAIRGHLVSVQSSLVFVVVLPAVCAHVENKITMHLQLSSPKKPEKPKKPK